MSSKVPPSSFSPDPGDFASLGILPDATAAQVLLEALTQEQIPVETRPVPPNNFLGPFSMVTMEAVEVLVPPDRLEEARIIHAALCASDELDPPEVADDGPEGASAELTRRRRRRLGMLLLALILLVAVVWLRST